VKPRPRQAAVRSSALQIIPKFLHRAFFLYDQEHLPSIV
jgi:hypothetical protein